MVVMVKKRAACPMGRAAAEQRPLAHLAGNYGRAIQQNSLLLVPFTGRRQGRGQGRLEDEERGRGSGGGEDGRGSGDGGDRGAVIVVCAFGGQPGRLPGHIGRSQMGGKGWRDGRADDEARGGLHRCRSVVLMLQGRLEGGEREGLHGCWSYCLLGCWGAWCSCTCRVVRWLRRGMG